MRCTKIRAEIKQSRESEKHGDEQIDRAEGAERATARFSPSSPGRFYRIACCSVKSRIIRPCAKRGIRWFHCSNWQHWLTTAEMQGHIPWTIQATLEALRTQPFSCCDCRRTMFTHVSPPVPPQPHVMSSCIYICVCLHLQPLQHAHMQLPCDSHALTRNPPLSFANLSMFLG